MVKHMPDGEQSQERKKEKRWREGWQDEGKKETRNKKERKGSSEEGKEAARVGVCGGGARKGTSSTLKKDKRGEKEELKEVTRRRSVEHRKEVHAEVQRYFDIFFGTDQRMRKEEMEDLFNKETKQGWRFAADASIITDDTAGREDCNHTSDPGTVKTIQGTTWSSTGECQTRYAGVGRVFLWQSER